MKNKQFLFSPEKEPHRTRTKSILKDHPEVRSLIGRNPYSILAILLVVILQLCMAYLVTLGPWWVSLIVAWLFGAFMSHILFVFIHECSHNLLFKKRRWNLLAACLANMTQVFPTAISFIRYHIKHHAFQGVRELDGDFPYDWEPRLFGRNFFTKALWLLFYPVVQIVRTFRLREIKPIDGWVVTNWAVQVVFCTALVYLLGWTALLYLTASLFFSVGFHPLGARWIQEHYVLTENQETYSYYGVLNTINFNIGYHNEHHDFPSIPWNNLPKLKRMAGEYYDSLASYKSWTLLWLRFLFDNKITMYERVGRNDRGSVPISDESIPDRQLINS